MITSKVPNFWKQFSKRFQASSPAITNLSKNPKKFDFVIDNSKAPFVPKIFTKPNSIIDLPDALVNLNEMKQNPDESAKNLEEAIKTEIFKHPYEHELLMFDTEKYVRENYAEWNSFDITKINLDSTQR